MAGAEARATPTAESSKGKAAAHAGHGKISPSSTTAHRDPDRNRDRGRRVYTHSQTVSDIEGDFTITSTTTSSTALGPGGGGVGDGSDSDTRAHAGGERNGHRYSIDIETDDGLEERALGLGGGGGASGASGYGLVKRRKRRRYRYAVLYTAIFFIAFAISLDGNTGYLYLNWACSEYGALSAFSTVSIVQQLTMAIAKPPLAKISDVFGRAQAYAFSLLLYMAGYLIVTLSASLRSLVSGLMLVSAGITGLQTLQSIIVADTTAPRYRGLVIGLCNVPFLINFLIAGPLVDLVLRHGTWRLGYGMWVIAMPIAAAPLLVTLAIGQRHARRVGLRHRVLDESESVGQTLRILASELDVLGIVLFSLSFALMLLPVTLAGHGSSIDLGTAKLLFILGLVLVLVFIKWEAFATEPLLPLRFFSNRTVVLVCLIGIADFGSFFLSWSFLSSFVQIVKGWDQTQTGWFASTQNVTSTAQGILVGLIMARHRRFKHILVWGVIIRLVGVSMMIKYRNADDPTFALVLCQLLQGIGGGSIAIVMQVAVQIAVHRKDVAVVTALELLTAEIGAAVGSALAGVLFATDLPKQLEITLPELSLAEREAIFSSLQVALSYPQGSAIRKGISDAWVNTMRLLCITATLFLLPALVCALALPDLKLPERHHHQHPHHHSHRHSVSSAARRKYSHTSLTTKRPRNASAPPGNHRAGDRRLGGMSSAKGGGQRDRLASPSPSRRGRMNGHSLTSSALETGIPDATPRTQGEFAAGDSADYSESDTPHDLEAHSLLRPKNRAPPGEG